MRSAWVDARSWLVLLLIVLLGLSVSACGGAGKDVSSGSPAVASTGAVAGSGGSSGPYLNDGDHDQIGDGDADNNKDNDEDGSEDFKVEDNGRYHDSDDRGVVDFGSAAGIVDRRAVTALIKRYYAAAAVGDASEACSLIASVFRESIPREYGEVPGPPYLVGAHTCLAVASRMFRYFQSRLVGAIGVTAVRVEGGEARVLLGSKTMPAGVIFVVREGRGWRIDGLLAAVLP